MPRDDRFVDMSLYELPDDELSEAELDRLEQQRIESQSRLINHSASMGMTPMEAFAAGRVTAEMPDDRLVYDTSRQLPAATGSELMSDVRKTIDEMKKHNVPPMPTAPVPYVEFARKDGLPEGAPMPRPVVHIPPRVSGAPKSRVQEWFDSGKGGAPFMEGFNSYFTPAPGTEVFVDGKSIGDVTVTETVDDDEVVDGEIVDTVWPGVKLQMHPPIGDIIDAEVIDEN